MLSKPKLSMKVLSAMAVESTLLRELDSSAQSTPITISVRHVKLRVSILIVPCSRSETLPWPLPASSANTPVLPLMLKPRRSLLNSLSSKRLPSRRRRTSSSIPAASSRRASVTSTSSTLEKFSERPGPSATMVRLPGPWIPSSSRPTVTT